MPNTLRITVGLVSTFSSGLWRFRRELLPRRELELAAHDVSVEKSHVDARVHVAVERRRRGEAGPLDEERVRGAELRIEAHSEVDRQLDIEPEDRLAG